MGFIVCLFFFDLQGVCVGYYVYFYLDFEDGYWVKFQLQVNMVIIFCLNGLLGVFFDDYKFVVVDFQGVLVFVQSVYWVYQYVFYQVGGELFFFFQSFGLLLDQSEFGVFEVQVFFGGNF